MPNLFKKLLEEIPQAEQRFIDKQLQIAGQVAHMLQRHGGKKIDFAKRAGIFPSQLSHILSGEANPTLEFITNLEATFGADIIQFPLYRNDSDTELAKLLPEVRTSATSNTVLTLTSVEDEQEQLHTRTQSADTTRYYSGNET